MELTTVSRLTGTECGLVEELEMPVDACQFFHQCTGCGTVLRPRAGDCCVFCSYGGVQCHGIQER